MMNKLPGLFWVFSLPVLLVLPWTVGAASSATPLRPQATPVATETPEDQESWIWLDLPPDATQLDHGKEVYRLVCSACHAYDGTGLTDEWRATWNPDDQNCWQSKCHASNHPPDGFYLPQAPAIVGPVIPALFETADDLHEYIDQNMPWQNPGSLTDEEVWAVTAYVLELNDIDPGPNLNQETAIQMRLRPVEIVLQLTPDAQSTPASDPIPVSTPTSASQSRASILGGMIGFSLLLAALGASAGYLILKRRS